MLIMPINNFYNNSGFKAKDPTFKAKLSVKTTKAITTVSQKLADGAQNSAKPLLENCENFAGAALQKAKKIVKEFAQNASNEAVNLAKTSAKAKAAGVAKKADETKSKPAAKPAIPAVTKKVAETKSKPAAKPAIPAVTKKVAETKSKSAAKPAIPRVAKKAAKTKTKTSRAISATEKEIAACQGEIEKIKIERENAKIAQIKAYIDELENNSDNCKLSLEWDFNYWLNDRGGYDPGNFFHQLSLEQLKSLSGIINQIQDKSATVTINVEGVEGPGRYCNVKYYKYRVEISHNIYGERQSREQFSHEYSVIHYSSDEKEQIARGRNNLFNKIKSKLEELKEKYKTPEITENMSQQEQIQKAFFLLKQIQEQLNGQDKKSIDTLKKYDRSSEKIERVADAIREINKKIESLSSRLEELEKIGYGAPLVT